MRPLWLGVVVTIHGGRVSWGSSDATGGDGSYVLLFKQFQQRQVRRHGRSRKYPVAVVTGADGCYGGKLSQGELSLGFYLGQMDCGCRGSTNCCSKQEAVPLVAVGRGKGSHAPTQSERGKRLRAIVCEQSEAFTSCRFRCYDC